MTSSVKPRRALQVGFVLALAAVASLPLHSLYAEPPVQKPMGGNMGASSSMMNMRREMMAEHSKMMADMTAKDAELTTLVSKLNSATQDAKVGILADIVTRLVTQQTAFHAEMNNMHQIMTREMSMMGERSMCPCMTKGDTDETGTATGTTTAPQQK